MISADDLISCMDKVRNVPLDSKDSPKGNSIELLTNESARSNAYKTHFDWILKIRVQRCRNEAQIWRMIELHVGVAYGISRNV